MALDPKWSEEARKNVKETSIDERMHQRIIQQREQMAADKEDAAKKPAPPSTPKIPNYAGAIRRQEAGIADNIKEVDRDARDDIVSEICERIMIRVIKGVREELKKLVEEGRLD